MPQHYDRICKVWNFPFNPNAIDRSKMISSASSSSNNAGLFVPFLGIIRPLSRILNLILSDEVQ